MGLSVNAPLFIVCCGMSAGKCHGLDMAARNYYGDRMMMTKQTDFDVVRRHLSRNECTECEGYGYIITPTRVRACSICKGSGLVVNNEALEALNQLEQKYGELIEKYGQCLHQRDQLEAENARLNDSLDEWWETGETALTTYTSQKTRNKETE